MKTRTLLLLAVTCGLAILLAGGFQLLRVSGEGSGSKPLAVLGTGRAGDATVTVLAVGAVADTLRVTVRTSGVDDTAGVAGFTLVAPGKVVGASTTTPGACTALTVSVQQCDLVFPTAGMRGEQRQMLFRRAGEQVRWCLAGC